MRSERLKRGIEQKDVGILLGVTESTVWNWENGRSSPPVHQCKRIIGFLGFDPFERRGLFSEELIAFRRTRGLRIKEAASFASVDPATWSNSEKEEGRITTACRKRIQNLLRAFALPQ